MDFQEMKNEGGEKSYIEKVRKKKKWPMKAIDEADRMRNRLIDYGLEALIESGDAKDFKGKEYRGLYETKPGKYRELFGIISKTYWFVHAYKKGGNETPARVLKTAKERFARLKERLSKQ